MHPRFRPIAGPLALLPLLALQLSGSGRADPPQISAGAGPGAMRYARVEMRASVPEVELTNARGATAELTTLLANDGPVLLQFIFTTCTSICPVMSATFAAVQEHLPADARLVSISIDPEHDTPERLRDYRERYRAGPRWSLWTGAAPQVHAAQRGFGVDRGNKMRHEPSTFLRGAPGKGWVRLDGFPGVTDLLAEIGRVREAAEEG